MGLAENIRNFWDDLFYSKLVDRLETDLLVARSDAQQLRQDKDEVIAALREERAQYVSKIAMYEVGILQRVGIDPSIKAPMKPSFANFESPVPMSSWQKVVAEHEAQLTKEIEDEKAAGAARG